MKANGKNTGKQDSAVEAARRKLDQQKCWHCQGTGARFVLYVKNGDPVPGAEYMAASKLLEVGFTEAGFIHANENPARSTCFRELSKQAPEMGLQLVARESPAVVELRRAEAVAKRKQEDEVEKLAKVSNSLSALAGIAKATQVPTSSGDINASEEVGDIETNLPDESKIPAAVPNETPATPTQVASSPFGNLMGFVKKAVEG